ncbi:MAG: hypothetical protein LW884_05050 [Bacteroidetes bacterium]|jgi:hypothetical protein|nr:hypothetical protein [Bacteroidota bacterium]
MSTTDLFCSRTNTYEDTNTMIQYYQYNSPYTSRQYCLLNAYECVCVQLHDGPHATHYRAEFIVDSVLVQRIQQDERYKGSTRAAFEQLRQEVLLRLNAI